MPQASTATQTHDAAVHHIVASLASAAQGQAVAPSTRLPNGTTPPAWAAVPADVTGTPAAKSGDSASTGSQDGMGAGGRALAAALRDLASAVRESDGGAQPTFNVIVTAPQSGPQAVAPILHDAAAPAAMPGSVPMDPENLMNMVQAIRVAAQNGMSEATVHLKPEALGDVTISIKVDGSAVTAVVHANQSDVRQWMQGQEDTIRGNLANHGLDLARFVVRDDGHPQQQREQQQPQRRRPRPRATAGNPEAAIFDLVA
jgi:flagellar hook-length control protein FliK